MQREPSDATVTPERVLVTGSSGFIGGTSSRSCLRRGYNVVGVDNHSKYGRCRSPTTTTRATGSSRAMPRRRAPDRAALADCDHFIAGAALIGGISYFHAFPYDLLATNERIIASSCDAAIRAFEDGRLQKVTYLSSSMVFESADSWPSYEGQEREIPPPRSSYGFQKLAVEYFARAAHEQYGLPYTIVRPFNCVGIGEMRAKTEVEVQSGNVKLAMSHVVPDLVQKIVKGQDPLHILGDGTQVRHYTYGATWRRGIVTAMEHPARAQRGLQPLDSGVDDRARARRDASGAGSRATRRSATCATSPSSTTCSDGCPRLTRPRRSSASRPPRRWTRSSTRSSLGSSGQSTTVSSELRWRPR